MLWSCAQNLRAGGKPPADFNLASLVMLAKKPTVEVDGTKWFAPKDTRPISIVNSDNRIIANLFRKNLAQFADKICRPEQRGFLGKRRLLDNVIDVDFESKKVYLSNKRGGLILVDLQAAFPSLSHEYLFRVLERQGIPSDFINALKMFYQNNIHNLNLDGESSPSVVVRSGVRQGCPMSPVLFALALDPFLHHLCCQLHIGDTARAYADDLAIVIKDMNVLPKIISCFNLLTRSSALQVNILKTVFVPLYETTILQARADIGNTSWAQMEIHHGFSKYLGFQVGPLADATVNYKSAMEKFRRRALHWLSLKHIGAYFQCFGFNMCCLSTLNSVSQLYVLPPLPPSQKSVPRWL